MSSHVSVVAVARALSGDPPGQALEGWKWEDLLWFQGQLRAALEGVPGVRYIESEP